MRTRRRVREAPDSLQRSLFGGPRGEQQEQSARRGEPLPRSKAAEFRPDDPGHLYLGDQRLDEYLEQQGLGWTLRLREMLQSLEYGEFCSGYSGRGRRPYHPRTLVSLIVYGVLLGQSSLRALETLARRDLGAWWLCGGQQPDHSTIGDFIQCYGEVISAEFSSGTVRKLVQRFHLKAGLVAADGTVIEAAVSRWGLLQVDALREREAQVRIVAEHSPQDGKLRAQADKMARALEIAEERGEKRTARGESAGKIVVSPHDPEAVVQPRKDKVYRPSYKPSVLVHESGLIVGQAVHPSSETAVVGDLLDQHEKAFGCGPTTALFDAGYNSNDFLRKMCERNIDVLCPSGTVINGNWAKAEDGAKLGKGNFRYDEVSDTYECPAGVRLRRDYETTDRGLRHVRYRAPALACRSCVLRAKCTDSKNGRTFKRYHGEEYREAAEKVLEHPAARARYRKRMALAESPTAEIRERLKFNRFRRVGTSGARVEFALCVLALNLKWAVGRHHHGPASFLAIRAISAAISEACDAFDAWRSELPRWSRGRREGRTRSPHVITCLTSSRRALLRQSLARGRGLR